jgi:hypothetical protein
VALEWPLSKRDQGPTIIRGDETTDAAPVGEQQVRHASVTLQEEKAQGRIDDASARADAHRALEGSKARKPKSVTSSTDIRQLQHDKKELAERSPDENDRGSGQADQTARGSASRKREDAHQAA